jgi:hypothetical protein
MSKRHAHRNLTTAPNFSTDDFFLGFLLTPVVAVNEFEPTEPGAIAT